MCSVAEAVHVICMTVSCSWVCVNDGCSTITSCLSGRIPAGPQKMKQQTVWFILDCDHMKEALTRWPISVCSSGPRGNITSCLPKPRRVQLAEELPCCEISCPSLRILVSTVMLSVLVVWDGTLIDLRITFPLKESILLFTEIQVKFNCKLHLQNVFFDIKCVVKSTRFYLIHTFMSENNVHHQTSVSMLALALACQLSIWSRMALHVVFVDLAETWEKKCGVLECIT